MAVGPPGTRVSHSLGWPQTYHVVEDALEPLILLSLCPKYWDCMCAPLSQIYLVLGIKARALSMLYKLSTHSATCSALYNLFWMTQISSDLANGSIFMLAHRWIFLFCLCSPFSNEWSLTMLAPSTQTQAILWDYRHTFVRISKVLRMCPSPS